MPKMMIFFFLPCCTMFSVGEIGGGGGGGGGTAVALFSNGSNPWIAATKVLFMKYNCPFISY